MVSKEMWALGANRSVIRDLFEYGLQQAKVVGPENVFDYSLGNPSIPSPPQVNETVVEILRDMDSIRVHGYTSALGDMETRSAATERESGRKTCLFAAALRRASLPLCGLWQRRQRRSLWPSPPSSRSTGPLPRRRGATWWWYLPIRSISRSI